MDSPGAKFERNLYPIIKELFEIFVDEVIEYRKQNNLEMIEEPFIPKLIPSSAGFRVSSISNAYLVDNIEACIAKFFGVDINDSKNVTNFRRTILNLTEEQHDIPIACFKEYEWLERYWKILYDNVKARATKVIKSDLEDLSLKIEGEFIPTFDIQRDWGILNPPKKVHEGDLVIKESQNIDFTEITGNLNVDFNATLKAPNLKKVGGYLTIISKATLEALQSVGGNLTIFFGTTLEALQTVGGDLSINSEATLEAPNLQTVGGYLYIEYKSTLEAPNLQSIGNYLQIDSETTVKAPNLQTIGGYLSIYSDVILEALQIVGGNLKVDSEATLEAPNLQSVYGNLYIDSKATLDTPKFNITKKQQKQMKKHQKQMKEQMKKQQEQMKKRQEHFTKALTKQKIKHTDQNIIIDKDITIPYLEEARSDFTIKHARVYAPKLKYIKNLNVYNGSILEAPELKIIEKIDFAYIISDNTIYINTKFDNNKVIAPKISYIGKRSRYDKIEKTEKHALMEEPKSSKFLWMKRKISKTKLNNKYYIRLMNSNDFSCFDSMMSNFSQLYTLELLSKKQQSSKETYQKLFLNEIESDHNFRFIIEQQDESVGFAKCHIYWNTATNGFILNMDELYVKPEHRNKGIAKNILKYLINFSSSIGCSLFTTTGYKDDDSYHLYQKYLTPFDYDCFALPINFFGRKIEVYDRHEPSNLFAKEGPSYDDKDNIKKFFNIEMPNYGDDVIQLGYNFGKLQYIKSPIGNPIWSKTYESLKGNLNVNIFDYIDEDISESAIYRDVGGDNVKIKRFRQEDLNVFPTNMYDSLLHELEDNHIIRFITFSEGTMVSTSVCHISSNFEFGGVDLIIDSIQGDEKYNKLMLSHILAYAYQNNYVFVKTFYQLNVFIYPETSSKYINDIMHINFDVTPNFIEESMPPDKGLIQYFKIIKTSD